MSLVGLSFQPVGKNHGNDQQGNTFDVRRFIRYHQRRRRFFGGVDTLANMLSVIFGSAVIYGILAANFQALALACAALVTVLANINLVVGSNRKAWLHADLARHFGQIA